MWSRELGEVENECTLHKFCLFAIFLPEIIKIGGNLTKFDKTNLQFFETRCKSLDVGGKLEIRESTFRGSAPPLGSRAV